MSAWSTSSIVRAAVVGRSGSTDAIAVTNALQRRGGGDVASHHQTRSAQDEAENGFVRLAERRVERGERLLVEAEVLDVAHYADHLGPPRGLAIVHEKGLADRILVSEEPAGEGLVHDDDRATAGGVALVEPPSLDHGYSDRLEIARAHEAALGAGGLGRGGRGTSLHLEVGAHVGPGQGEDVGQRHRLHTRQGEDAPGHLSAKDVERVRCRIAAPREGKAHEGEPIRLEARVHGHETDEAP